MRSIRSLFYLAISFTLLLYAVPRFHLSGIHTIEEGFAILWSFFAMLVIGAHLYRWMDEEEKPHTPQKKTEGRKLRLPMN